MKSFQEILERRVRNTNASDVDFYTIEKAVKEICKEIFGQAGEKNIFVKKWNNGILMISAEKSLWKSELVLNQKVILFKINKILNMQIIKKIIIV